MELQIKISNILGDHSYVCARHFLPEDIIVHPNLCRLTTNAVPSVFKNYPTELPRQFFKKICQTADDISSDCNITELDSISLQPDSDDSQHDYVQEVTIYDPAVGLTESESNILQPRGSSTKLKSVSNSRSSKNILRRKFRSLQARYEQLRSQFLEAENKLKLYNIDSLERDAADNNEEAIFLLEMLRSYTIFERTRQEILSSRENEWREVILWRNSTKLSCSFYI